MIQHVTVKDVLNIILSIDFQRPATWSNDYAKRFVNINNDVTKTIMYSRKFLLWSGTDVWIKKDGDKDSDVTMGSFDEAEICELVGLYILH